MSLSNKSPNELREILIKYGRPAESVSKLNKYSLIKEIKSLPPESQLEFMEVETEEAPGQSEVVETPPDQDSEDWTEYVLSKLTKDEQPGGCPSCDGLRRVFHTIFGTILSTRVTVIQAPADHEKARATVTCEIVYRKFNSPDFFTRSDAADCFEGNTDYPYYLHPTATAATMAEGRCLRKILGIKVLTSEEATGGDPETVKAVIEAKSATDIQKATIKNIAGKLGIVTPKLMEKMASDSKITTTDLEKITYIDAQELLRQLQSYQRDPSKGGQIVPKELLTQPK